LSEGGDEEERSDLFEGEGDEERSDSSEGEGEDDGMVHESDSFHSRGGLSSMTKEDKIAQRKNSIQSRKKVFAEDKVIRKQSSIKSGNFKLIMNAPTNPPIYSDRNRVRAPRKSCLNFMWVL
jgi:hypothetical protein